MESDLVEARCHAARATLNTDASRLTLQSFQELLHAVQVKRLREVLPCPLDFVIEIFEPADELHLKLNWLEKGLTSKA